MSEIRTYRKRPVPVEAIRWFDDDDERELRQWVPGIHSRAHNRDGYVLVIPTLEGETIAQRGDWIIKGVKGEFYACKPDIFDATYEYEVESLSKERA